MNDAVAIPKPWHCKTFENLLLARGNFFRVEFLQNFRTLRQQNLKARGLRHRIIADAIGRPSFAIARLDLSGICTVQRNFGWGVAVLALASMQRSNASAIKGQ